MRTRTVSISRSQLIERTVYIDGKPLSFRDYPFQRAIYDCPSDQIVLKTCRQVGKTVYDANLVVSDGMLIPFFKSLYVAPTMQQTSRFSATRLSKIISYSPIIRERFATDTDNVFLKIFANGSEITLNYACDDADRIRSITADRILLDEVQDMELPAILPVIMEVSANSDYAYETFTGTPKSMENGLEWLWKNSTQAEWIMKCPGCSKWNFIDHVRSIGLKGPVCVNCDHLLNPRLGQWYEMNPSTEDNPVPRKGFHVSQPILPKNVEDPKRWARILRKREDYDETKFKNEVLGVSDSSGSRMISLEDLQVLCGDYEIKDIPDPNISKGCLFICGGVDWSGGGVTHKSRTVLWIWGVGEDLKLRTLFFKIFPGRNQVDDVREVARYAQMYRVQLICGDAGEGAVANAMLREILGSERVYQVQYGSLKSMLRWNGVDRWQADRTAFIDSFMLLLKRGGVMFPKYEQVSDAFEDVLAMYEETTKNGEGIKVWRHSPAVPDDSLHAMIFGWIASRLVRGEFKMY